MRRERSRRGSAEEEDFIIGGWMEREWREGAGHERGSGAGEVVGQER